MKNVMFISPTGTMDNGAEISIFNLMKYLSDQGNQVVNIAPVSGVVSENDYSKLCKENGINCFLVPNQRWWWEDAPGMLFGTDEQRATSFRSNISFISEKINEFDIDLVVTNTVNMFQGAIAAAIEEIPHIWLIHEFPEDEFRYYKSKMDFINDYADEIYAVRGKLKDRLSELFKKEVKSFAPYTELKTVKLKEATKHRIVSVGRINERKNQLELIKAYRRLDKQDIELVFIGAWDEPYKKICLDYIKKYHLNNITFMGNVADPWEYVTDKDLCVFSSSMETFGLVYVEALLNGVPVVLSDNPGHLSAFDFFDHGCVYPLGDIERLSQLIEERLENYDLYKSETVNFSVEAQERYQISFVYQELIESIYTVSTSLKSIRHLKNLLTLNERKSKLAQLEFRIRNFLQRVKYKIKKH
ncbi:glycosyltransferase family 4 protein [Enterococcus gallinarum]|uniref:Capsular polysaccharide biosynthesis protein n=1 Tax=Enterococcus gallinarum TaxID=1353 RepID=A0A376GZM2_ENTGA|nr:glycosyltransferase family 4 protein [Enterococcus gallinarum]MDT2686675.1 glycosyltransferase family 4 protein [Enterococcus gallinarum]MDT2689488.1 glycosyltransferase family 4 protein [Enterococcus gallinarum]OJG48772.1 glycosyltransferase, group 1 family protein [Enterococcus gallinarum]STD72531.1 capsular polysaccharide biosynthesis protein [Enterococcus gallinarum]STD82840.1 capsular polysaccharide biosynthesis protein [Enterococcus gallinarum]